MASLVCLRFQFYIFAFVVETCHRHLDACDFRQVRACWCAMSFFVAGTATKRLDEWFRGRRNMCCIMRSCLGAGRVYVRQR